MKCEICGTDIEKGHCSKCGTNMDEESYRLAMWKKKYGEVSLGYVEDTTFNDDWEEMKLICGYEHCIEHQEYRNPSDGNSCPIFGYDCPGGSKVAHECWEQWQNCDRLEIGNFVIRKAPAYMGGTEILDKTTEKILFCLLNPETIRLYAWIKERFVDELVPPEKGSK